LISCSQLIDIWTALCFICSDQPFTCTCSKSRAYLLLLPIFTLITLQYHHSTRPNSTLTILVSDIPMFFWNPEKKKKLKENKEHDGIYWRRYHLLKWNPQNYLFIYLANMCGRGQCTTKYYLQFRSNLQ